MKKIFTLLFMVAMISSISFAQDATATEGTTNGPVMNFESMTVDYGTIEQNSDPLRSFIFTNTGNEPLQLSLIHI